MSLSEKGTSRSVFHCQNTDIPQLQECIRNFPGGPGVNSLPANAGDPGSIPGRGNWSPMSQLNLVWPNKYLKRKRHITQPLKKNTFESVLMRWMKLEPIIQSEVSQKEKHQYSILMHIYGI